jgi:hypothetical protein
VALRLRPVSGARIPRRHRDAGSIARCWRLQLQCLHPASSTTADAQTGTHLTQLPGLGVEICGNLMSRLLRRGSQGGMAIERCDGAGGQLELDLELHWPPA